MTKERREYMAFLLRLWQADSEEGVVWRASVDSPHTGERHTFSDLDLLITFLEEKTAFPPTPRTIPNRRVA